MFLCQATTSIVIVGPMVDKTDGDTEETGLTIAQADVRLSKNGGAGAQKADATATPHDEKGKYLLTLSTTDTGTCGELFISVHVSGALVWEARYWVLPALVYNVFKGSVTLPNGVLGQALTEAYPTKGAAVTGIQALYAILQFLYENSFSGTTGTIKTRALATAKTVTINDADNPTSIVEAT
jgi:hypothetical protein